MWLELPPLAVVLHLGTAMALLAVLLVLFKVEETNGGVRPEGPQGMVPCRCSGIDGCYQKVVPFPCPQWPATRILHARGQVGCWHGIKEREARARWEALKIIKGMKA